MLTVYFKPTNYCHIGCNHCYLPESTRAIRDRMSLDKVKQIANFLAEATHKWRDPDVYLIWHGGEPLILPPDYFYQVGEIFDNVLPEHKEGIQTSLIPYSNKYKDVIQHRFKSFIGTSIDFDARTINGSSEVYQSKWMEKVELAREHGNKLGLSITLARKDLGRAKERIDWLIDRKFDYFNFERYNSFGKVSEQKPSNKEHAQFLVDVFDVLLERISTDKWSPMIQVILAVLGGILNGLSGDRWGGACQHNFIVIEPDGSLNNCPDKALFEPAYSNIDDGLMTFQNSEMRKKWIRIQSIGHRIHYCNFCENNAWCGGGCPITPNADEHSNETECSGYKTFITYVRRQLENPKVLDLMERYRNGEFTPSWSVNEMNNIRLSA